MAKALDCQVDLVIHDYLRPEQDFRLTLQL